MDENRRRVPQKKKIPLKKRLAYIIVNIADEREKSKAQKRQKKAAQHRQPAKRPNPQRRQPPAAGQNARAQAGTPKQRRPLTPQEQRRLAAKRREQQRKRVRNLRIGAGALVVMLIVLILSRTVLFKIQNIDVTNPGDAKYTEDQIATASGVVKGTKNLFSCNLDKIEKNIEQGLPYIGKAEIKRDFPSTLRVTVTTTETAAAIAYGTGYLLIDINGKMLESTLTVPEGIPVLRCNPEFQMNLGQYIGVALSKDDEEQAQSDKQMIELVQRIMAALETVGMDNITLIDIRDVRAITLMYDNRLTLHLGTEDQLEDKLGTAVKTISAEADSANNRTGAIDLTNVPYAYSRDTFAQTPEQTTEAATE